MSLTFVVVAAGLLAPWLAPNDPFAVDGPPLASPSGRYPMGTDALGRDLFSGIIFGARTAVIVAGITGIIVLVVGLLVGTVSGYIGGRVDDLLMRITEFFQVIPRFFTAIIVIALFGPGLDRLVLVLGFTSWSLLARVIRSEVLSLREREFVEAARADGASHVRIMTRELLPNAIPAAMVFVGLIMAQVLLIEASLGFLGLGDPNAMSWGFLASQAQQFLRVAWWMSVFPGLAIIVAVLGLNLLGDAVTDQVGGRR
ncbi:MAG: ABC transporter permease [Acidimicrobiales bacterium]|nr:ABC transporter permease [Acidimicrobiales bacterium]